MKRLFVPSFLLLAGLASAQTLPCGLTGCLDASRGSMLSHPGTNVSGSVYAPLGAEWGAQLDGLYTRTTGVDFKGLGTQLRWRFSDTLSGGLVVAGIDSKYLSAYEGGVSGAYRLGWATFSATGGYERFKYDQAVPFIDSNKQSAFGIVGVTVYPWHDFAVSVGGAQRFGNRFGVANVEYQTPVPGLAVYLDAAHGERSYNHFLVGVRYYFGARKTLQQRHGEDAGVNPLHNLLYGIGEYGREFDARRRQYIASRIASGGSAAGSTDGSTYGSVTFWSPVRPVYVLDPGFVIPTP